MSDQGLAARYDPQFGRSLAWDIDLLSGYNHEFVDTIEGSSQSSFLWLRLPSGFTRKIVADGADTLWIQGWQVAAYWQAVHQARQQNLPIWLRAETNLRSTSHGWKQMLKAPLLAWLLSSVDRFLCIGEANREYFVSQGISSDRLARAPYCVDNERFSQAHDHLINRRRELRHHWNIPPDATCLLFVGKLIEKKRPQDLIDAANLVMARRPERPVHLLFVGTGEFLDSLRANSSVVFDFDANLSRRRDNYVSTSFAGFLNQSEISKAYTAADCLVLPSQATETWGLVVNEAMASGLPAIVSDACGCSDDLIKPIRPDLCFPVADTAALARAIESFISRPQSASEVQSLISNYDILRTVEAVEKLYLLQQPGLTKHN
ncbi:MAG: glycosyltransferase family 4 protein [Hyphomicrobiaceae bacterium]